MVVANWSSRQVELAEVHVASCSGGAGEPAPPRLHATSAPDRMTQVPANRRHPARGRPSSAEQLGDPRRALEQVVVAEGVREAQVAGAPNASPGTTATSASSRINAASSAEVSAVRPSISRPSSPATDGKHVERRRRQRAVDAVDVVEHAGDGRPATVERRPHLGDSGQVAADGGQGGDLGTRWPRWRWRATAGWSAAADHVGRADHPAHPPAGHGVRLGHPVEDDAALGRAPGRAPASR